MFKQVKAPVVSNAVLSTVAVLKGGNAAVVKEAQLANAEALIVVTAAGIAIDTRTDDSNADCPIEMRELGRPTDFKSVQPLKALAGIVVQLAGIVTSPLATSGGYMQAHVGLPL